MMKRLCLFLAIVVCGFSAGAAEGDTTWVQAHNTVQLPNYGNYDVDVTFPDGSVSYRKIIMTVTLGKYQCPGNPQYCGDWDYTVQNYLMTPGGDTLELGRLITPYANVSYARFPWTWKERYEFDVTDYYTLLKNMGTIRLHYSGYSGGFTADIKFAFIQGTPPRNITGIHRLWHGSFQFGNGSSPIDDKVQPISKTAPAGTQSTEVKINITGHGADDQGCGEFCKKYYQVKLNSNMVEQKDIWRDDCGKNHLYPQSGTWVYDRANWCPGDLIHTNTHKLPGIVDGNTFDVDMDFEPYTGTGSLGSYTIEGAVIYYAGYNKSIDASIEDIIAPTNHEAHYRENPTTAFPIIKIRNTGSTTITSVKIEYGMPGKHMPQYNWTGTIEPMKDAVITLPELWELRSEVGTGLNFTAKIISVNSQVDEYTANNTLSSVFNAAPQWADKLIISFKTNNAADPNGISETSYRLLDGSNNVVKERINNAAATLYTDTVQIGPGFYKLVVEDKGCDGLSFWANTAAGSGSIQVKKIGQLAPLLLTGHFNGDFGCGFTQYFNMNWPTSIENINTSSLATIGLYPNPAANAVTIALNGIKTVNGTIRITDAIGRVVMEQKINKEVETLNTTSLVNGVYSLDYADVNGGNTLHSRLVIAK